MKINNISLTNFRKHAATTIALDKVNVFSGPSLAGKSSIVVGLEHGLTARNVWTDGRGAGASYLVTTGQKKSVIELAIEGRPDNVHVTIPADSKKDNRIQLDEKLVQACLRCRSIFLLPEKEQRDLILSVLDIPEFDIYQQCNSFDERYPDLGDVLRSMAEKESYAGQDIDLLAALVGRRRDEVKADLRAEEITPLPARPIVQRTVTSEEIAAAYSAYEAALIERGQEEHRLSSAASDYEPKLREYRQAVDRRAGVEKSLADAEEKVTAAMNALAPRCEEDVKKAGEVLAETGKKIADSLDEIDRLTEIECPEGICCKKEIRVISDSVTALRAQQKEQLGTLAGLERVDNEAKLAKERAEAAEKLWDSYKKQLDSLPATPPEPVKPVAGDTAKLEELKAKVAQLSAAHREMEAAKRQMDALATWERDSAAKTERLELLQRKWAYISVLIDCKLEKGEKQQVTALGPKGIKAQVLAQAVGAFEAKLNTDLAPFGLGFKFQLDPWLMLSIDPDGAVMPATMQPQTMASVTSGVLQRHIAEKRGFGIIAIDEHGMDPAYKRQFLGYLLDAPVQSILCSTLGETDDDGNIVKPVVAPGMQLPAGMKLFYVEKGVVVDLTAPVVESKPEPVVPMDSTPEFAEGMRKYLASGGKLGS